MANDSNSPATKADLAQLATKSELAQFRAETKEEFAQVRAETKAQFDEFRVEMRTEMTGIEDRLTEKMRDMETRLLGAFYSFAESNQKRLGDVERDGAGVKDRLAMLESRLMAVEKRLNMPPAA